MCDPGEPAELTAEREIKFSWNDQKCYEISRRDLFPSQVTDLLIQKEIITMFLDFYLSGKIRKGLTVCDVIFATISIMPQSNAEEKFIWPSTEYSDHGSLFHISAEDKLKAEIRSIQSLNKKMDKSTFEEIVEHEPASSNEHQYNIINDDIDLVHEGKVDKETSLIKNDDPIEKSKLEIKPDENKEYTEDQATQDKKDLETDVEKQKKSTGYIPSGIKWEPYKPKTISKVLIYGPVENAAFNAFCNELLEQWHTETSARIQLKILLGYLALVLMRATAKSPKHLINTFSTERFLNTMQQLIGFRVNFSIPQKKCISKTHRVLSKRDLNIPTMFGKIVIRAHYNYGVTSENLSAIFFATVLKHTFNYGMGMLGMLRSILMGHNKDTYINILHDVTLCDDTEESWNTLREFVCCYMLESSKNVSTYHWACILDKNALNHLGCQHNYALSVIFSVFIEKQFNNPMVWEAVWVKNSSLLDYFKALGVKMYEKFCSIEQPVLNCFVNELMSKLLLTGSEFNR